jgi:hypothetical protein
MDFVVVAFTPALRGEIYRTAIRSVYGFIEWG